MRCKICERELDNANDLFSVDCGGDCLLCMAKAGDPECLQQVGQLIIDAANEGQVRNLLDNMLWNTQSLK